MEKRLLIFLEVPVIREGQSLEECKETEKVPYNASRFTSCQFKGIRVFLVRHQARTSAELVGQCYEGKLLRGKKDNILRKPA